MTTTAPYHNKAQFERAIEKLIQAADAQNRGGDLDRVVKHMRGAGGDVSRLAALMALVDEDFRGMLRAEIEAYRRFETSKGRTATDDDVASILEDVYARIRG